MSRIKQSKICWQIEVPLILGLPLLIGIFIFIQIILFATNNYIGFFVSIIILFFILRLNKRLIICFTNDYFVFFNIFSGRKRINYDRILRIKLPNDGIVSGFFSLKIFYMKSKKRYCAIYEIYSKDHLADLLTFLADKIPIEQLDMVSLKNCGISFENNEFVYTSKT